MKVPKHLLIIGIVHSIRWTPATGKQRMMDFENHILATNSTHSMLFIFPNDPIKAQKEVKKAIGRKPAAIYTHMSFEIPDANLKAIGTISQILYTSDWWEGNTFKYEHEFTTPPKLYADRYSRFKTIGIKPKTGKILSKEGIQG